MKYLLLTCLAVLGLLSFTGCSDTDKTTTSNQSASLQTDTKAMHPANK